MSEEFLQNLYKNLETRGMDNGWCHWFVGLAEGEGSFTYEYRKKAGQTLPRFFLSLQGDTFLMEDIHAILGIGQLNYVKPQTKRPDGSSYAGRSQIDIRKKEWLSNLVEFFEAYPLRSKKREEFAIWKRMVKEYVEKSGKSSRLRELALTLSRTNRKIAGQTKQVQQTLQGIVEPEDN